MSVDQILAIESDEKRRDYLETVLREHINDANHPAIGAALAATFDDPEEIAGADPGDPDEYLTELLDRATDDGIAVVLRAVMAGAYDPK
ncbi:MAG: hypothetical protein H0T42_30235 [Deltaproteobacteria bacterium]|nr:hypothetical protein [Deltaproteobacteria bacterium]